jgi:CTP:molybdopterin cytidylyltransferase MocA
VNPVTKDLLTEIVRLHGLLRDVRAVALRGGNPGKTVEEYRMTLRDIEQIADRGR